MKKLVLCLVFLASKTWAQEYDLKKCLQVALNQNPNIQAAQLLTDLSKAELSRTKSLVLPTSALEFYQSTNTGRSIDRFTNAYINELYNSTYVNFSIRQPLFQGFQNRNQQQADRQNMEASKLNEEAAKNALRLQVVQAYLSVLQQQELLTIAQKQQGTTKQQIELSEKRLMAGINTAKDVTLLKTQWNNEAQNTLSVQNSLRLAMIDLFSLMNMEVPKQVSFAVISVSEATGSAVDPKLFPQLEASLSRMNAYTYQVKAVKSAELPRLDFYINWNTFYASSNPEQAFFQQINATRNGSFTLGLSIPIGARLQTKPNLQRLTVLKAQEENTYKLAEQQLIQAKQQTYERYELAKESYKNAKEQVNLTTQLMELTEQQVAAGTVQLLEYILAKNNYDRALATEVSQKYAVAFQRILFRFYETGSWE